MSALYLFYAIIAILLISIAVTVATLLYHLKITARLNSLEEDIEKKAVQFDAIKKEHEAGHGAPGRAAAHADAIDMRTRVIEMPLQINDTPPGDDTPIEEGSIQIFRNVGGTFENTNPHIHAYEAASPEPAVSVPPVAVNKPQPAASKKPPLDPGETIRLYSPALRGPDFNQMYRTLVEVLKKPVSAIAFDCAGIEKLGDGELDYLEKIHQSLTSQRRSLSLINCPAGLAAIFERRPGLGQLLR